MHENSRLIFEKYARSYIKPGSRVLEIAPDGEPSTYQSSTPAADLTWESLEIVDSPHNLPNRRFDHMSANAYSYPLESNSFDVVLSGNVIEHVRMTWKWMQELARVCKPGGHVITRKGNRAASAKFVTVARWLACRPTLCQCPAAALR